MLRIHRAYRHGRGIDLRDADPVVCQQKSLARHRLREQVQQEMGVSEATAIRVVSMAREATLTECYRAYALLLQQDNACLRRRLGGLI